MMNDKQTITECATLLKLHYVKVNLETTICQAQMEKPTYISFLAQVLKDEVKGRQERDRPGRNVTDNEGCHWRTCHRSTTSTHLTLITPQA